MRTKVSYLKVCWSGSEQKNYKVLVGNEIGNINGNVVMEDLNYQFRKFKFYIQGS